MPRPSQTSVPSMILPATLQRSTTRLSSTPSPNESILCPNLIVFAYNTLPWLTTAIYAPAVPSPPHEQAQPGLSPIPAPFPPPRPPRLLPIIASKFRFTRAYASITAVGSMLTCPPSKPVTRNHRPHSAIRSFHNLSCSKYHNLTFPPTHRVGSFTMYHSVYHYTVQLIILSH